jgi:hypothetical protein
MMLFSSVLQQCHMSLAMLLLLLLQVVFPANDACSQLLPQAHVPLTTRMLPLLLMQVVLPANHDRCRLLPQEGRHKQGHQAGKHPAAGELLC